MVKYKDDICAELCPKLWSESGWCFCNINESGWFWKRLSRKKIHWHWSLTEKSSFSKPITSVFPPPIKTFSYGAEIFLHSLVQLTGHICALLGYTEMQISHHLRSFEFFESQHGKLKYEFANIFVMVIWSKSIGGVKVLKVFNQKSIYLLRKMQKLLNVTTLNLRKHIFCPEYESTLFVKINLSKILRKNNFILLSVLFIKSIVVIVISSKTNHSRL